MSLIPSWLIRISFFFVCFLTQIAAILTLPFDVVKTRRQIQLGEMEALGGIAASVVSPVNTLERVQ